MSRRNQNHKPKRGLGQAVTRARRKAAEAAREEMERMNEREREAARAEMRRAEHNYEEDEAGKHTKFANGLLKSVVSYQTAVLRSWGYDQSVHARTHNDKGVLAYTDFQSVHCYWPERDIPDRMDTTGVADVVAQIKGAMQHEFGHLRFTTSWYTVNQDVEVPKRHRDNERLLFTCWNMIEDQRMETLVVGAVPRIGKYFGTMIANVVLQEAEDMSQSWLMLAGRTYLPGKVLKESHDLFEAWAADQGVTGAGATWWDLIEDYKAASSNKDIMKATSNCLDFINKLNATMPDPVDDHRNMDDHENDGDPSSTAQKQRGNILDMFRKGQQPSKPRKQQPGEEKSNKPSLPNSKGKGTKPGEDGEGEGEGQDGEGKGKGDEEGEQGRGGFDDYDDTDSFSDAANDAKVAQGPPESSDEVGQSNRGEAGHKEGNQDLNDALSDMVDEYRSAMRNDSDVMEMAWDAQDRADTEGLPEYESQGTAMSSDLVMKSEGVALGIQEALNHFVSQTTPIWQSRQEDGVIDALAYRTKQPGDRDFRRELSETGNDGLDVHVSCLCDVSYSMDRNMGALSTFLYSTALACDALGIGRTLTLWSSGKEYWQVHGKGEPTPSVWPCMGGTDPTPALDDLSTHNQEGADNHLVLIFTDGAWASNFPPLTRWSAEGRTIVLIRYGSYEGAVQTDMGADTHIQISNMDDLPNQLTDALCGVLAGSSGWK